MNYNQLMEIVEINLTRKQGNYFFTVVRNSNISTILQYIKNCYHNVAVFETQSSKQFFYVGKMIFLCKCEISFSFLPFFFMSFLVGIAIIKYTGK